MARSLYPHAFLVDLIPLYPLYALLFADSGLSATQISSLLILWSFTAFVLEIPSGVLADLVPRRFLLTAAPLLSAAGFALWTFFPVYPAFAAGFMLWGTGEAITSGTRQALVYDELDRAGAASAYARLIGRSRALGTIAVVTATAAAAPLLAHGGYTAVGTVSIAAALAAAPIGYSFPEGPRPRKGGTGTGRQVKTAGERKGAFQWLGPHLHVMRTALSEVRHAPGARPALFAVAMLMGLYALEEYLPFLVLSFAGDAALVPLLLVPSAVAAAAGEGLAGRGGRRAAPLAAAGALLLAVGALVGHMPGILLVSAAFGVFAWASVIAETRLQDAVSGDARATVVSMSGFGAEGVAIATFAAYGLGSGFAGPGALFAAASLGFLAVVPALRRRARGPRSERY
ncbi:MFS transporter [Nocardiopsis suaedae]|uniref:MFS transporter n=1 Tax=Nocardiopsis suaedae TaxID=3018444 RepID=A0ABT4TE81_9ACTN|nr:MFS transporter [Nocardiopsis suaedae]MDA2802891.1 MFS transporter [Nocardiopsis suaedae]